MKKPIILVVVLALLFGTVFALNNKKSKTAQARYLEKKVEVIDQVGDKESDDKVAICYDQPSSHDKVASPDMYTEFFTYIMNLDLALNEDMKYIAVDYQAEISSDDKANISKVLKTYGVDVFESKLENLSDAKHSDEYGNLSGILLIIKDVKTSDNVTTITFTKYKSGMGSISAEVKMTQNESGNWEVEENDVISG